MRLEKGLLVGPFFFAESNPFKRDRSPGNSEIALETRKDLRIGTGE